MSKEELAKTIVELWKEYCSDKEVLENTDLLPGWPVLSGSGFLTWLRKKYE